jgi:hypothetical protein
MVNEAHMKQGAMPIREILRRSAPRRLGGRVGRAELLTGIEGASSGPVRKIVPMGCSRQNCPPLQEFIGAAFLVSVTVVLGAKP